MKNLILIFVLVFFTACEHSADDVIWLLPDNYKGSVVVIHNQKDGEDEVYENGKRVYRIPKNEVLKTKFKANYGTFHQKVCYQKENGERIEIPLLSRFPVENFTDHTFEPKESAVYHFAQKGQGEEVYFKDGKEISKTPRVTMFLVGYYANIYHKQQEQLLKENMPNK